MTCPEPSLLLRDYVDSPEPDAGLAAHVAGCATCNGQATDLHRLRELVAAASPSYDDAQRRRRIVAKVLRPERAAAARPRPWLLWLSAAGLAVAGILLAVQPASRDDGFAPRAANDDRPAKWVGMHVFRLSEGGVVAVDDEIQAGDAVLFSYTNLAPSPHRWLVIVGRDASGAVHWYHPPAAAPDALAIASDVSGVELREAVRRKLPVGKLVLAALFSPRPLPKSDVEAWLVSGKEEAPAGCDAHRVELIVMP